MNKLVTILCFSSRKNGNCAAISQFVSNYYKTNVRVLQVTDDIISPCGNCDYECLKPGMTCPRLTDEYRAFMQVICDSNLVYFVVPNYCGYPCANYFAFNERSVGYFGMDREKMKQYMNIPKRFIIVSNSEGFEKAMQQQTNGQPDILYLKSGKYKKRSVAGDILECEEACSDLEAFLAKIDS